MSSNFPSKEFPRNYCLKNGKFWSVNKRSPSESIESYFNRYHELLDELSDANEPISTRSASQPSFSLQRLL
jgi:hypothetical protein